MRAQRAFTVVELSVVVALFGLGVALLQPIAQHSRRGAHSAQSLTNLQQIGRLSASYALDSADRLPTYSWKARGNTVYRVPSCGNPVGTTMIAPDDLRAGAAQMREVVVRMTGRDCGATAFRGSSRRLPHRRYSHLVLADYAGTDATPDWAVSPGDANLATWAADPIAAETDGLLPYQGAVEPDVDQDASWANPGVIQRWPYSSSYLPVPASWDARTPASYVPIDATPHLFQTFGSRPDLGGRRFTEVRHPSRKVYFFQEFDWDAAGGPHYFAYADAVCPVLMFDGSAGERLSGDSNPSYNPADDDLWRARYVRLDTFPGVPTDGGHTTDDLLSFYYMWTRGGLAGIDF